MILSQTFREYLVQSKIKADSIQPDWCVQNIDGCESLGR